MDLDDLPSWLDEPSRWQPSDRTPLTVLTGFLGAGKTTVLNRVLAGDHGLRIAVLVNDFGDVDIDSQLVVGVESGAVSLANGCVCCEIRDDLVGAIETVLAADGSIDSIVLEASGVAEPMGIARTFVSPRLSGRIRLDGIVAVVDAEQLPAQAEDPAVRDLVFGQVGFSDLVVLNKIDLADRARLAAVRDFVESRLPAIRIIEATHGNVPIDILSGRRADDVVARLDDADPHEHSPGFVTWVHRRRGRYDEVALEEMAKRLPRSVYRIKGFFTGVEQPGARMLFQSVGMRGEVTRFDERGDPDEMSALVVIAAVDVDRAVVEELLDSCLVDP